MCRACCGRCCGLVRQATECNELTDTAARRAEIIKFVSFCSVHHTWGTVFSASYLGTVFSASYLGTVFSASYLGTVFSASYLGHSVQCVVLGYSVQCIILGAQCSVHHTWGTVFSASYLGAVFSAPYFGHSVQYIIVEAQCSVHHTWGTVFSASDQGTCRREDGICPLLIVPFIDSRITAAVSYREATSSDRDVA